MVAALRQTRTTELGDMGYAEALRVLSESLDSEAELGLAGRRLAKAAVVELLVRRAAIATDMSPVDTSKRQNPIVVCGLPGSGASKLRRALRADPRVAPTDERFDEIDLRSVAFESRWHVPAYAEWLQGADPEPHLGWVDRALIATGDARPAVVGGWGDIEHLEAVRHEWPTSVIVVVSVDELAAADAAIARCLSERDVSGSRTDADVIERYWRWRVAAMSERLDATLDLVTVHAPPGADPAELVEQIIASA